MECIATTCVGTACVSVSNVHAIIHNQSLHGASSYVRIVNMRRNEMHHRCMVWHRVYVCKHCAVMRLQSFITSERAPMHGMWLCTTMICIATTWVGTSCMCVSIVHSNMYNHSLHLGKQLCAYSGYAPQWNASPRHGLAPRVCVSLVQSFI